MMSTRFLVLSVVPLLVVACGGGTVDVGSSSQQELKKKSDGSPSGNGTTCSFDDVVWHDASTGETGTIPSATGQYAVGDEFASPDGCNDCTCTDKGIMCTMKTCSTPPAQGCTEEAKQCPDGSYVSRTGPSCEFAPCPSNVCPALGCDPNCPNGVKKDASGCDTCQCADAVACTDDAKLCPDGKTYVSRTGPNCEFSPCP